MIEISDQRSCIGCRDFSCCRRAYTRSNESRHGRIQHRISLVLLISGTISCSFILSNMLARVKNKIPQLRRNFMRPAASRIRFRKQDVARKIPAARAIDRGIQKAGVAIGEFYNHYHIFGDEGAHVWFGPPTAIVLF